MEWGERHVDFYGGEYCNLTFDLGKEIKLQGGLSDKLTIYFNGLKTRQPLQTQLLPIQENFDLRECQSPVNWELDNMKYLVVLVLLLYCRHV